MKKTVLTIIVLMFLAVFVMNIYHLFKLLFIGVAEPVKIIQFLLIVDIVAMILTYVGFKFVKTK